MKTTILCCIVLLFVACPVFGQFDPWSGSASVATPPALIASDAPVTAEEPDYSSRLYARQVGWGMSPDASLYRAPGKPVLQKMLDENSKAVNSVSEIQRSLAERQRKAHQARQALAKYYVESRLAEIKALQPKTEPNGRTAGLGPLDFPELDGSTSCRFLGQIVAATVLDLPYLWEVPISDGYSASQNREGQFYRSRYFFDDKGIVQRLESVYPYNNRNNVLPWLFQISLDKTKTTGRQQNFFRDYIGKFQGTHNSYLSLLSTKATPAQDVAQNIVSNLRSNNSTLLPFSDILLVERTPSADELALAEKLGVEFDILPVALDAFVFIVNGENPVESLSLEQIRNIYLSQQLFWKDFGWKDANTAWTISPYERAKNSGSRELMDALVLPPEVLDKHFEETKTETQEKVEEPISATPAAPPFAPAEPALGSPPPPVRRAAERPADNALFPTALPANPVQNSRQQWEQSRRNRETQPQMGMMGTFYTVADNATSLAYSVHYYERYMIAVPQTRVIAVDGVSPSYETIRTKKYPLIAPVYAVTIKGVPADSPAAKLRDWLLSEDGQRTIRKSGLVPIDEKIAAE